MKRTKWKTLFFTLLAGNIVVVSLIFILMNWPIKDKPLSGTLDENKKEIQFEVKTTRDDLTQFINQYLERKGLTESYHYEVFLTDEVELYGKLPFFNREVDLKLTFKPITKENGDLILKQESISIGTIRLPVSYVMNFIDQRYNTPKWVDIQPDSQSIYVSLHEMKWKSNVQVKAKNFDLEKNDISFLLSVPQ